jgi:hypothetical protein
MRRPFLRKETQDKKELCYCPFRSDFESIGLRRIWNEALGQIENEGVGRFLFWEGCLLALLKYLRLSGHS